MPIIRICPSCNLRLRIKDPAARPVFRCPRCQKRLTVEEESFAVIDAPERRGIVGTRVFISHAHGDRDFVEQTIKPLLERHGVTTWWSQENIRTGENFQEAIRAGIRESDWFMVILSPNSQGSDWVRTEIDWALADMPHRMLSVQLQPCNIKAFPEGLASLHFVDFAQNPEVAGRKILADIIRQLSKEARENQEKVEQLSRANDVLKHENVELKNKEDELEGQLDTVMAFDGNWTHAVPKDIPPFRSLKERRAPIIAVANLKGGVGKTTLTANLAASLWNQSPKQRVLLLDLDYQANLTQCCLDPKIILRLRHQERLIKEFFEEELPTPKTVIRCAEPILDDRQRATEGYIVASDELLGVEETYALTRWLVGKSEDDIRFRLRSLLHADEVQRDYNYILLDCPPRLTTTYINALTAADYLVIPVLLDDKSTEGAPRLLRWLSERKALLSPNLSGVGIIANKTKGATRAKLVGREQEEWEELVTDCDQAWHGKVCGFDTVVPLFTETAMARKFPAAYREMGTIFGQLVGELRTQVKTLTGVRA